MAGSGYWTYIWAAYGVTALGVVGLVARAIIDHRAQVRALAGLTGASGASGNRDEPSDG